MATSTAVSESALIRYSRWSLAATVACMPLYVVRYKVGPIPTTLLEDLILITIGLYAAGRIQNRDWRPARASLEIPIVVLLVAGLVGIAISSDHVGAVGIYRAYFIEPVALFYVAIDLLKTPHDLKVVLLGLAIGATIFALMNLGAWVVALATHQTIHSGDAPEALYTSPNAVAMFRRAADGSEATIGWMPRSVSAATAPRPTGPHPVTIAPAGGSIFERHTPLSPVASGSTAAAS